MSADAASARAGRRRRRPGAGRPTRAQAEARHAELLDAALDQFLEDGFERATIEAIASSVGMTKRTVYARHDGKAALFLAAIGRAIERIELPEERLRAALEPDLEATLLTIARLRVAAVTTPAGLRLQRIINMESYRFPEIFTEYYERSARPVVEFVAEIFTQRVREGELELDDPALAANLFMSMVLGGPVRSFMSAVPLPANEMERRLRSAIRLFLDGARRR